MSIVSERSYYPELLSVADKERSTTIIENDSFLDSADVYERFFLGCSEEIFIMARGIKKEIFKYSKVKNAAIDFLNKENTKLNMILRYEDQRDYDLAINSSFIQDVISGLSSKSSGSINIKFYEGNDNEDCWFDNVGTTTIGDNRAYRFRYYQEDKSLYSTSANANVCFNDVEACRSYKKTVMDVIKNKSPVAEFSF